MINSCTKESETPNDVTLKDKETIIKKTLERPRIKIALRHPGFNDPENPNCDCAPNCVIPACPCKLGMCISRGLILDSETWSDEATLQSEGALGYATIEVNSTGKLQFEFEQETCYLDVAIHPTDKLVELTGNYILPSNISTELGYSSVEILTGTYYGDFSTNSNGIIECDIVTTP